MLYKDMISYIKLPDILSILGLIFAVISIIFSINKQFFIATILITISMILDYSDGKVSRHLKRKGNFGKELDNLCDVVLYLVAVIVFAYMAGLTSFIAIIGYLVFIIAGVLRLARFGVRGIVEGAYEGLPVGCAIVIPYSYLILDYLSINLNFLLIFFYLFPFIMVSSFRVKKF